MTGIEVDGRLVDAAGPDDGRLSDWLRDVAGATGVKVGCEEGACGACTVQLDDVAVPSCLVPLHRARGSVVRTATSLAATTIGARVVAGLAAHAGAQCGFCTPGIVVEAVTAMEGAGPVTPAAILAGHLCRCTGYAPIEAGLRHALAAPGDGPAPLGGGPRVDVVAKARGEAVYAADAGPRPQLFATVVGSPVAHARIRVDATAARAVPGVRAVLGSEDDPGVRWSPAAHGTVLDTVVFTAEPRFVGDVVAAVAATTRSALARGVAALVVEVVEELPEVSDLDDALRPGAPLAWSASGSNLVEAAEAGASAEVSAAALAGADAVHEATYTLDPAPHGYLERPAAVATWAGPGAPCRVWSTTQHPYLAAPMLARILGTPLEAVSVEPVYVGGGFGGKEELWLEPAAALVSRACGGAAVLLEVDRAMTNRSRVRHGGRITIRSGVRDGRIVAWDVAVDLDAGADSGHSPDITRSAIGRCVRSVPVPAARAVGRAVRTNTTPATAYRGFGGPEAFFAVESELDDVARRLGVDPVELRIAHGMRHGGPDPLTGGVLATFELEACLRRAVALAGPPPVSGGGLLRGRGVAASCDSSGISRPGSVDDAEARCALRGGRLVVETGVAEIGQGNHTAFRTIAAEALGVEEGLVGVSAQPSSSAPADGGVYASRGVYVTGTAVHRAAGALLEALRAAAGARLGCPPAAVVLRADGVLEAGGRRLHLTDLDDAVGVGTFVAPDSGLVAAAQIVDAAVDPFTGVVRVERVVSVHDIGRVVHQAMARGQVLGAVVQGIGLALLDPGPGAPAGGFLEHLVPTAADVPEVVVDFVEVPHPTTPLGAKGIGEAPIIGIAPAIANAVADATGARVRQLPLTPERVLAAIDRGSGAAPEAGWRRADRHGLVVS